MKKNRNGKSQFIASLDAITTLKNEGQTGIHIYEHLIENKKITLSYRQFLRYLSDINNKQNNTTKPIQNNINNKQTPPKIHDRKRPSETPASRDIFREEPKIIHNPRMTDARRKELF